MTLSIQLLTEIEKSAKVKTQIRVRKVNMTDEIQNQTSDDLVNAALNTGAIASQETVITNEAFDIAKETADSNRIAETLSALQGIIERNAHELQNVEHELKEKRQMLKNIFDNDTTLHEAEEQAQTANKKAKERKTEISNNSQAVSLKLQIAEINQNKKEIEEALSNHLVNYHQLTGSTSFDTSDGDQWDFSIRAKVKISK